MGGDRTDMTFNAAAGRYMNKLESENKLLRELLSELADLVEDAERGDYIIDSFTTQPARQALKSTGQ